VDVSPLDLLQLPRLLEINVPPCKKFPPKKNSKKVKKTIPEEKKIIFIVTL